MFNANIFFKERFSNHLKETSRYLKYIFNGHFVIAVVFLLSALAYYYQRWLMSIPPNFPTALVIGGLFGLVAGYSPVRTLLKEPDLVFLLPAEHKMGSYFRNTIVYSFIIQIYLVFLVSAALGPLYFASYPERSTHTYLLAILVLIIFKLWHVLASWWILKIRDLRSRWTDQMIRTLLSIVSFYFYMENEIVLAGITTLLLFGLFGYNYYLAKQNPGVVWDLLVEKDRLRMQTFYRIANMFTDVPQLKTQIKKRHWLVSIVTSTVPFQQKKSFDYLYRITSIRSSDYLGMYVRLVVIGGLAIYFVPNFYIKVIFGILFLYLSGFQLMTIWQHHRTVAWLQLYPLKTKWRETALLKWLLQLLIIQTALFGLVFVLLGNIIGAAIVLIGGLVFSYLFVHGYVRKRLS